MPEIITPSNNVSKTQAIRLFDVFLLGPFMVWAGMQSENKAIKTGLIIAGVGTVVYNGGNYLEQEKVT